MRTDVMGRMGWMLSHVAGNRPRARIAREAEAGGHRHIVTSSYYGFPEQQRTQQRTQQGTQQRTQQRTHSARTWVVILVLLVLGHQEL